MRPSLRVLILSNRKTYASTVRDRCQKFDSDVSSAFLTSFNFRSYTEDTFRPPSQKALNTDDEEKRKQFHDTKNAANRRLVSTPRIICSIQSLGRLFAAIDDFGEPIVPHYDIIIPDEFMELLAIFHGTTMDEKRRTVLEQWTSLMTRASSVIVADADFKDDTALPILHGLTGGKAFLKLENTAKTINRVYYRYHKHAQWRRAIVDHLANGKKVFVACNTKAEVLSITSDPAVIQLITERNLRVKGLHAGSPSDDRRQYIDTVSSWKELDLLVFSPTISHGVNFDEAYFDVAFLYASDNSTKACQTFQQLNRARQIRSNQVHFFIHAHPKRYAHLPCEYNDLKAELNAEVRRTHSDWFVKSIGDRSKALPANKSIIREIDEEAAARYRTNTYVLDTKVDPVSSVRQLFDSLGNELYLRNQLAINRPCANFERLLIHTLTPYFVFQIFGGKPVRDALVIA